MKTVNDEGSITYTVTPTNSEESQTSFSEPLVQHALDDSRLSPAAIGVLGYLAVEFKGQIFTSADLRNEPLLRREEIREALKELEKHGYLNASWTLAN